MDMEQQKSGDCGPASEIVFLNDFRVKDTKLSPKAQGHFSVFTLEATEEAWLEAKRRCLETPTRANIAAEAILHMAHREFWRLS